MSAEQRIQMGVPAYCAGFTVEVWRALEELVRWALCTVEYMHELRRYEDKVCKLCERMMYK